MNCFLTAIVLLALSPLAAAYTVSSSSYLGDNSDVDVVYGTRIQSDGTIVLAGIATATFSGVTPILLNGASETSGGIIVRLNKTGETVLSVTRVADSLFDLALDGNDNIYVAAGDHGAIKLTPEANQVLWVNDEVSNCRRIDASAAGISAALHKSSEAGRVLVYDASGNQTGNASGLHMTQDVAVSDEPAYAYSIGFANKHTGVEPVQVPYLRAHTHQGVEVWKGYDWPGNYTNNGDKHQGSQADTRGYRVTMGADGKLYAAYESHGGNSIIRYDPFDVMKDAQKAGGDKYHQSWGMNGAAAISHICRYEPQTGDILLYQTFVVRLTSNNRANTFRSDQGDIIADSQGRVYFAGNASCCIPISWEPFTEQYYLGGAAAMILSSDMSQRLLSTRLTTPGVSHSVAFHETGAGTVTVWGGHARIKDGSFHYTENAIQQSPAGGSQEGYFFVLSDNEPSNVQLPLPTTHLRKNLQNAKAGAVYSLKGELLGTASEQSVRTMRNGVVIIQHTNKLVSQKLLLNGR